MNQIAKTSREHLHYIFGVLVALFILLATNLSPKPILVNGWAVGPTSYQFNIENAMKNGVINIHCKSDYDDLGLVRLPVHNNYTHAFKTQLFKTMHFFCELNAPNHAHQVFDTFKDVIEFVDHQCGGRHCFWKATEDGIFLFHIQRNKYFKMYDWDRYKHDDDDNEDDDDSP